MNLSRRMWLPFLFVILGCLSSFAAVFGDDQPTDLNAQTQTTTSTTPAATPNADADDSWHVTVSPYLWFPGMSGVAGAKGHQVSVHVTPADLLSNFNFGLMGAGEIRKKRFLLPMDFMWVKLAADKATPFDPGVSYAKLKITQVIFTPGVGYRVLDHEKLKVDARLGLRYWHLGQNLSFQPSGILSNLSQSANWVDVVAGAKIAGSLTPKVLVTVFGDAGGGQANSDYEFGGLLGYKVGQKIILQAGWRYLDVNYRTGAPALFIYDTHESGILFGLNWILK